MSETRIQLGDSNRRSSSQIDLRKTDLRISDDTSAAKFKFAEHEIRRWKPPFEEPEERPFAQVYVRHDAYIRLCVHAGSDLDHEVGGGLVGEWGISPDSDRVEVIIEAALPARFTRQGSAFLTFTQDTLVAMNDELEERHSGKLIVGWYHTHPRMGVFLSSYDIWLHQHFFPEPWQVALVMEPHAPTGGFFIRQENGHLDTHRYFGFSEIVDEGGLSVVHWKNLEQQELSQPDLEGVANE